MFNTILGVAWTIFFSIFDYILPEVSFSFLYLLPVAFVTWFAGQRCGLAISILSAFAFAITNTASTSIVTTAWNVLSTFAIFLAVSMMLWKIRQLWEKEKMLSRTDPLTGVMNLRAFFELVEYETLRLQRQDIPFSIAYLDLDNFKMVNDRYGHAKGDELLKAVVVHLVQALRRTDVVARLGGDEFSIFMPATGEDAVRVVMQKIKKGLQELAAQNCWPVSFSMGVISCNNGACPLDEIISQADKLMYEVKNSGKNDVRFGRFSPPFGDSRPPGSPPSRQSCTMR